MARQSVRNAFDAALFNKTNKQPLFWFQPSGHKEMHINFRGLYICG